MRSLSKQYVVERERTLFMLQDFAGSANYLWSTLYMCLMSSSTLLE